MNTEPMTKSEIQELSHKLYKEFCTVSEHLQSEKHLISYFEKDKEFMEPRSAPFEYCWNRSQERIQQFTSEIQNLKKELNKLADIYDSRFAPSLTRRSWENS